MKKRLLVAICILSSTQLFCDPFAGKTFYKSEILLYKNYGGSIESWSWLVEISERYIFSNKGTFELQQVDNLTLEPSSNRKIIDEYSIENIQGDLFIKLLGKRYLVMPGLPDGTYIYFENDTPDFIYLSSFEFIFIDEDAPWMKIRL
jgi:hypothetical protein